MRYFKTETETEERIGYDFYCDIANNIAKARKQKGWSQKQLAQETGIKLSSIVAMEAVKMKIKLPHLEKLSKALDVTVNWLIDAEIDSQIGECLYLIWPEAAPSCKLYYEATSKREAFLSLEKRLNEIGVKLTSSRERVFVRLVGVPMTEKEIKDKFPKLISDEEPIYPEEQ